MKRENELTNEIMNILKEESTRQELIKLLRLGADSLKNLTYSTLLNSDSEYQKSIVEKATLLEVIRNMNLSKEQFDTIELLLAKLSEAEYHIISNAYMAGILDGYKILKNFNLTLE